MGALGSGCLLVPLRQGWFVILTGGGREKGVWRPVLLVGTASVPWRKEREADTWPALSFAHPRPCSLLLLGFSSSRS